LRICLDAGYRSTADVGAELCAFKVSLRTAATDDRPAPIAVMLYVLEEKIGDGQSEMKECGK
jgi:hypothetical protein